MIDQEQLAKIPEGILEALHERGVAEEDIPHVTLEDMFCHYCNWHGLVGWGETLFAHAASLHKLSDQYLDREAQLKAQADRIEALEAGLLKTDAICEHAEENATGPAELVQIKAVRLATAELIQKGGGDG